MCFPSPPVALHRFPVVFLTLIYLSPFDCHLSPFTTSLSSIYRPLCRLLNLPIAVSLSPLKYLHRPLTSQMYEKITIFYLKNKEFCIIAMFESPFSLGFLQKIILLCYFWQYNIHNLTIWVSILQYIKVLTFIFCDDWPRVFMLDIVYIIFFLIIRYNYISNQYYFSDNLSIHLTI